MIELKHVSKSFQDTPALAQVTAQIQDGLIFGLVGSNGAGKSTLLRLVSGILKPEEGEITLDTIPVFEHSEAKRQICFLSDTVTYFPNATPESMGSFYQLAYPAFDMENYKSLLQKFNIQPEKKLQNFSKGQKKQVSLLLGFCANTRYLLCDETFDGLDPVVRQAIKSLFAAELLKREFTPVIASHSLRELEDICDTIGLLHQGSLLFAKDLDSMKCSLCKMQCVIPDHAKEEQLLSELSVLQYEKSGSLLTVTARGSRAEVLKLAQEKEPIFAEVLPLSLEEIFISETEVAGYDIKNLIQ
ncbi:ABC transporter ATP-binding protein [Schaedlerella arabinosiphila]|uniref:ABC transporter ATP-binding protein n=1 Tax=Schaedlerella arabinosiphila TaxID=2044587 RepID=A0A426DF88_9FIRM|nr:ABC transporter ATP-binding protein [Schaedlerella arabinosiphila]MCI9632266.1 ABC transporter ATP-binding protein [Ruminococcus sp.]NBI99669.1 ABC transporter ATP-binding protein [Lachnospiraceae bacterium]RRK31480.1 ABC transporter ATP-binding protein [Schaedlerella arabinosiphila]